MRITRKLLQNRVDRLNVVLNRPKTAYTKLEFEQPDANGHTYNMKANHGHFTLDSHSPGDGWTRYHLAMMLDGGGETNVSHGCNAQEMFAYLRGALDVLYTQYTHTFDNLKSEPSALALEILEWAKSGRCSGNPYMHKFVRMAQKEVGEK
jgi:hypothetical protein